MIPLRKQAQDGSLKEFVEQIVLTSLGYNNET
ncbi:unnamed protein product, partial [Rotaria sordida]